MLLAAITATFGPHCDLVTATRRDVCLAQLELHRFDVVIAGDKLSDYTGLELLSEVPVISPDTLLIFAADPKRLQQLGKRLAVFGLFEAISYPLTPQKLVDVLRRAREKLHASRQPKVRHVVLESEWDTGERLGLIEREAREAEGADDFVFAGPPTVQAAASAAAERILEGTPVVSAAGVPDAGAASGRSTSGRTFEGTQVAPRRAGAAGASRDPLGCAPTHAGESGVTEYEVMPLPPALPRPSTHESSAIEVEAEDEFVFATEVETASPVTPASVPVAQDTELEAVEDEAAITEEEFDAELEFICSNDAVFDVPEPPKWAADGAANDTAFEGKTPPVERHRGGTSGDGTSAGGTSGGSTSRGGTSSESAAARGRATALPVSPPAPAAGAAQPASAPRAQHKNSPTTEAPAAAPPSPKSAGANKAAAAPAAATTPPAAATPKDPPQRRERTQTVPTEAQRAAFERALARRNAGLGPDAPAESQGRSGKTGRAKPTIQLGSTAGVFSGLPMSGRPSASLSDLAKMATSKRPLPDTKVAKASGKAAPNRAVFVVGSGVAAVLVLGVLSFELLRHSSEAEHHMPHAQALSTQVFSPSTTLVASSNGGPAQLVAPPPGEQPPPQDVPPNQPQAQTFDAETAPEDPPPPPVLEHPGPSEPPSAPTMGNTDLPPWALSQQQAWGTTSSDTPNE